MPREIVLTPSKTYATLETLRRAIGHFPNSLRYLVISTSGRADLGSSEIVRYYPVFIGREAVEAGVHHHGFPVVG